MAPRHQGRARCPPGRGCRGAPAGRACRARGARDGPVRVKGSPTATSPRPSVTPVARAERPGLLTGGQDPDVRGRLGRAADQGQPLTVGAQRGDGDAGLLQLGRGRRPVPAPLVQPDQRVPSRRRPAGDERAVGGLGHGALAEHPVGPVELRRRIRQRRRFGRHVRGADKAIGQPPTAPVRDEAQRPVAVPGGLADRLGGPAGHLVRRSRRHQGLVGVRRAGGPGERDDQNGRGVPGHVRVIPGDHGDAATGRIGTRRAEEVEPLDERALTRRRAPRRQRDHLAHRDRPLPAGGPRGPPAPSGRPRWR